MKAKVEPKFSRAILLQLLAKPFVARGGSIHELLHRNRIPIEVLSEPNHLVEAATLYAVFEDMAATLGDAYFCGGIARDIALKGVPTLLESAASKTLGDFLVSAIVETGRQFDNVDYSLNVTQRAAVFSIKRTRTIDRPTPQADAVGVAFYATVFRSGLGSVFDARQFIVSAPSIEGVPPDLLPAQALVCSPKTALSITFPPRWLTAAFSLNWSANNDKGDRPDQPRSDQMTLAFVRATIRLNIADKEFDLTKLADACKTSRRSIQRILASHGTSFRALQDDVRREAAIALVTHSKTPLKDVARQVGFSNETSFTRSYSRWIG